MDIRTCVRCKNEFTISNTCQQVDCYDCNEILSVTDEVERMKIQIKHLKRDVGLLMRDRYEKLGSTERTQVLRILNNIARW